MGAPRYTIYEVPPEAWEVLRQVAQKPEPAIEYGGAPSVQPHERMPLYCVVDFDGEIMSRHLRLADAKECAAEIERALREVRI